MSTKILVILLIIFVIIFGYLFLNNPGDAEYLSKIKHETENWALIKDSKGDIMAVETVDQNIWVSLKNLNQNQSEMWIGGIVEGYNNYWDFRFKPNSVIVAEITIEGAQSNIRGISQDLDYWINVWSKQTYVLAKVEEIHESLT